MQSTVSQTGKLLGNFDTDTFENRQIRPVPGPAQYLQLLGAFAQHLFEFEQFRGHVIAVLLGGDCRSIICLRPRLFIQLTLEQVEFVLQCAQGVLLINLRLAFSIARGLVEILACICAALRLQQGLFERCYLLSQRAPFPLELSVDVLGLFDAVVEPLNLTGQFTFTLFMLKFQRFLLVMHLPELHLLVVVLLYQAAQFPAERLDLLNGKFRGFSKISIAGFQRFEFLCAFAHH